MRKIYFVVFIFLGFSTTATAQIPGNIADSLPTYLCKKWEEKARFLGVQQIQSYGDKLVYEFKADHSFVKIIDNKAVNGTWSYDSTHKVIQLLINNKNDFYVVVLKQK